MSFNVSNVSTLSKQFGFQSHLKASDHSIGPQLLGIEYLKKLVDHSEKHFAIQPPPAVESQFLEPLEKRKIKLHCRDQSWRDQASLRRRSTLRSPNNIYRVGG